MHHELCLSLATAHGSFSPTNAPHIDELLCNRKSKATMRHPSRQPLPLRQHLATLPLSRLPPLRWLHNSVPCSMLLLAFSSL